MHPTDSVPFLTRPFEDLSTDTHTQYRYFCDCCQEAHTSEKQKRATGVPVNVQEAIFADVQLSFRQCPQCELWVCRESCWEPIRCLCESCSQPEFKESAQATHSTGLHPKQSFSSILGQVCSQCKMMVEQTDTVCPECGQAL